MSNASAGASWDSWPIELQVRFHLGLCSRCMLLEITELHSRVLTRKSPVAYDLLPLIPYHARLSTKREFSSGQPSTTTHGGQIFSVPPFSFLEGPVSAGFRFLPCGRNRSDFPGFCPQRAHSSLFSLFACGRVHELSPVFMGASGIGLDLVAARALGM